MLCFENYSETQLKYTISYRQNTRRKGLYILKFRSLIRSVGGAKSDLIILRSGGSWGQLSSATFSFFQQQWRRTASHGYLVKDSNQDSTKNWIGFTGSLEIPREELAVLYQKPDRPNIFNQRRILKHPVDVLYVFNHILHILFQHQHSQEHAQRARLHNSSNVRHQLPKMPDILYLKTTVWFSRYG